MAQLSDFVRAKTLLRHAVRAFGPKEAVARARYVNAEAEIALASRDLNWPTNRLDAARATLEARGDRLNAAHACSLQARRFLLIGRLEDAECKLADIDPASSSPAFQVAYDLIAAGIAMRRLQARPAYEALTRAERSA